MVSKDTILDILKNAGFNPGQREPKETWLPFLRSQTGRVWSCDFFTVESAFLKTIYVYFIIDTASREIVLFGATRNPSRTWLETLTRTSFAGRDDLCNILISDRDQIYGDWFKAYLADYFDIKLFRAPPRTPNCNAVAERAVKSFRSELVDHRIVYGVHDLQNLIAIYVDYYNHQRCHQSLGNNAPKQCFPEGNARQLHGKIKRQRKVAGLVVDYSLAA